MSEETGVVSEPDGGFELGQDIIDSAAAGFDGLVDTLSAFFQVYLLTSTMFLLAISVLFVVIFFIGQWPNQYGTQIQYKRTKRSLAGLLLTCAIFPILYAAGWIGTGSTSHDGLPQDGIFGTGIEERLIGVSVGTDGLGMVVDVIVALFRMYLATMTTVFLAVSVLFFSIRAVAKLQPYGEEMIQQRSRRSYIGLALVSIILPLLYIPVWVATGSQSPSGYDLPSDGVFGTTFEERLFGPGMGEGGFGQLVSILANIFHTYQVTISFFLVIVLIFLAIGYALVQWPNELANRGLRTRLKRVGLGVLASVSFIPILYAVGWVATGFYTPDESMTWVAPRIQLPYEELFTGPDYHPFIQDLSASSDPLAVVLRNLLDFQSLTIVYVGIAALVTGIVVYTVFDRTNYIDSQLGEQSFRGGVILLLIAFLIPFLITGAAWVVTGVPDDGYLGDGPPGFSSDCTGFETTQGGWETVDGHTSPVLEPAGMQLNGTISQEFEEVGLGDRSVTIRPISSDKEFTIRMYEGEEKLLEETTEHSASYIVGADEAIRVEVESDGGEINELCVGFEPVSDPQLDIAVAGVAEDEPLILRRGITMEYTVYNVGEVYTGSEFDVHLVLNGTDPWGEPSSADSKTTMPPMAGGEFSDEVNRFTNLRGTPPTGRVKMVGYVDPYNQLDERTTVPNIDGQYIDVVYANMYGHIDATGVNNNATDIQTRVTNNGTIYSDETTADVTIYDEDNGGEPVQSWSVPVDRLSADESQTDSLDHTFRSPGNYTAEINVDEFLFPRGSVDTDSLQFIAPDLHGELVGVEDDTRVDTPTEFTVSVQNKGNERFDEQTNATVELVDSAGTVTQERVLTVPSLDEGEYYNQSIRMTPQSGGSHTVQLDVDYSLYPYGTTDSEDILSVGPSFRADIPASNVFQTEASNITATVTNNGNADSRASQMYVSLTHPNGTEIGNKSYEVPALEARETHSVESPFDIQLNDSGEYEVQTEVDSTLSTNGASETSSFEVYSFNISTNAAPIEDTNEVRLDVTLENLADSRTGTDKDVVVTAYNDSNETISTDTVTFGSLNGGEAQTRNTVLELDDGGDHTGVAELQVGKHDTATTEFNHSWPDQRGSINATQTSVSGAQSTVQTLVTNAGSASSEPTTAAVRLYDVESGRNRVYTTSINLPALAPGESAEENVTVEFPDEGVYEAEIDVDDPDLPENNVDTTDQIGVSQSEINVRINRQRNNVPSGENGTVDVTISNAGSDESGSLPVQTEFTDPDGEVVDTMDVEVGPIPSGESVTITHTTELSTIGTHRAESVVRSDISGTVRDSTPIEVVEPYIIDVRTNQSRLPVGEEAEVEVSITNAGTEPREPNEVITRYIEPDGGELARYNETVAQLDPGEEHVFTFNRTLENPGVHDIVGQTQVEDSTITDSARVEAIDTYIIDVEPVEPHVTIGDTGEAKVTVENVGNEPADPNTVSTSFESPDGTNAGDFTQEIPSLAPGEAETFRVDTGLNEYGIYDVTSEIAVEGFQTQDTTEIEVVEPFVVSVDEKEPKIDVGENGEVTVSVRNIGDSTTDPNTVNTTFYNPIDEEIAQFTREVPSLNSGEEVTYELDSTLEKAGVHDVEGQLSSEQYTVTDTGHIEAVEPDLTMRVGAEEDQIGAGDDGVILADITNIGTKESQQRTVDVEFEYENGTTVDQWETTVEPLDTGDSTTLRLSSDQLTQTGEYTGTVQVEHEESGWITGKDTIEVSPSALSVDVTARNVEEGDPVDVTTTIENTGLSTSDATTATVRIEQSRSTVAEQTFDVQALASGESQTNTPFNTELEPGDYDVDLTVDTDESETQDYDRFEVGYWDLKGDIAASDEDRTNQHEITVRVPNEGSVRSEPTTATLNITGPSGEAVKQEQIDVPAIAGGRTHTHDVNLQVDEGGEYTAALDVADPARPDGTTDQETFVINWGDLKSTITASDQVNDNEADFQIEVVNDGPGESYATTGTVNIRDNFGNILEQYPVDVPALQPGESYETSATYQFERPGTYEGEVDVSYPEFPQGTADTTGDVDVVHGNLNGRVFFNYGSSDVGTEAGFVVQVTNTGNDLAQSTTADVEIENRHGEIVYDTVMDVPALEAGESARQQMAATLNTSGTNTVRVDVDYPEFPIGNQGEDQVDVVSPDLQTELDVEDTRIGDHTNVTMTIVNDGEMTASSTTVSVVMYNDNDRRVVSEEFGVQSLGPGESVTIEYSQLIAPECWRTEMTCEPGASINDGQYRGVANADTEFAEQGSIGEDTFLVEQRQN